MKLTIIFFGLIIHVNQPWSLDNTAVLPDDDHHTAVMWIPKAAVTKPAPEWIEKWCKSDPCVIPLKNFDVRVKGTRGRFSTMSPELIAALPPLRTLAPDCRGLRVEVLDRIPGEMLLGSFIDYRGGKRDVAEHFRFEATFPGSPWEKSRCLACKVSYVAELKEGTATLVFTNKKTGDIDRVKIDGDNTIEVRHLPGQYEKTHFGLHYRVFEPEKPDEPCVGPAPFDVPEQPCDEPTCKERQNVGPWPWPQAECTNSSYP